MAFTLATEIDNAVYRINLTLEDQINEQIRKVVRLNNPAAPAEGVQAAMRAFEDMTDAALVATSASVVVGVTGASTVKGNSGDFSYVKEVIVLGFSRPHPLNAAKTATTTFSIPAPASALYSGTSIVIPASPASFAAAASVGESFAYLIDWLEDNLVFEDFTGAVTIGGWTFDAALSGIISQPRILDGVANT